MQTTSMLKTASCRSHLWIPIRDLMNLHNHSFRIFLRIPYWIIRDIQFSRDLDSILPTMYRLQSFLKKVIWRMMVGSISWRRASGWYRRREGRCVMLWAEHNLTNAHSGTVFSRKPFPWINTKKKHIQTMKGENSNSNSRHIRSLAGMQNMNSFMRTE